MLTGRSRNAVTELVLDPAQEAQAGLTRVSYAVCNNFPTVDQARVYSRRGELSGRAMREIKDKVRTAPGLP